MAPRVSPRKGTKLTPEQKQNLADGRKKARMEREAAKDFFANFSELLCTPKFWRKVPEELRTNIVKAIKKANTKSLAKEVKNLEAMLAQKKAEMEGNK